MEWNFITLGGNEKKIMQTSKSLVQLSHPHPLDKVINCISLVTGE